MKRIISAALAAVILLIASSIPAYSADGAESGLITEIEITLPELVGGELPSHDADVPSGANYRINTVGDDLSGTMNGVSYWMNGDFLTPDVTLLISDVSYTVDIYVEPAEEGYEFAPDDEITVTVNGVSGTFCSDREYPYVEVTLTASAPPVYYSLWLGETQVSSVNKDDILSDGGKAKFDPETSTLTLDDPVISTVFASENGEYCTIYAEGFDLTIKGRFDMPRDRADFGLFARDCDLTLKGDFTIKGTFFAVYARANRLNISSGSLTAESYAPEGCAVVSKDLFISSGASKFDAVNKADKALLAFAAVEDFTIARNQMLITPEGGSMKRYEDENDPELRFYSIFESDGIRPATHVVFERQYIIEPTAAPTEAPTAAPTAAPTEAPTLAPTSAPTEAPTAAPTVKPTQAPTAKPTQAPTAKPTQAPTAKPIQAPTAKPTQAPTQKPTEKHIYGLLGDADLDDEVTILDATAIQRKLAGLPVPSFSIAAADSDEDGEVSILDATAIQRWLAGLPANSRIDTKMIIG